MKVILATGGRAYADKDHVWSVLDEESPDLVIHGGALTPTVTGTYCGADYFASTWCDDHDVPQLIAPYKRKLGKQGGPIRNTWMIKTLWVFRHDENDCSVIAFPGGRGTADTIDKAIRAGFTVRKEMPR